MPTRRAVHSIATRIDLITRHIDDAAVAHLKEQRHLDAQSVESAYWHAGYRSALIDALNVLENANPDGCRWDKEAGCPSAFRDGKDFH
ncbi:MAG TPA: hypothetical protein PKD49_13675 [Hyphomicrobium sp.]|nr:hypothetical protein [Hyphomicrobium sp.]